MAKPFGPKFDRSLATDPPPEVRERPTGENPVRPPGPPNGEPRRAEKLFKPWPTREAPLAQTNGEDLVAVPPNVDWEEPPAPPAAPGGEYLAEGYLPTPGAAAGPSARDADPAGYDWEESAQTPGEIGMDLVDSSPLLPGRRPLYKRSEPPPSAEEQLESVIEFLRKLQKSIRHVEPEVVAPSPTALGLSLLQLRRLSRTGVAPDHFEIGVLPKPPKIEAAPPADTEEAPAEEATPERVETRPTEPLRLRRKDAVWLVLTGGLSLVTLGLVAYLWTRLGPLPRAAAAPRSPVARGTPGTRPAPEVSEEALHLANLALEAMQRGDLKQASDILTKAQTEGVALPGVSYQAALLAFNQGHATEADHFIEQSIAANEAVSDCWYLRANAIFFTEGPAQAAEAFEQAVAWAPFNPRFYFFRAECLRRNGNAAAAVGQFQQALRCRPSSTDTELILFKIGLTKIETNTDLIFKTELHDRLAQEPVSGDTLLLAAADAISRNEFAEGADFLKRAALSLPPRVFQARIRDYVFQAQARQPDIAAVLKLTLQAAVTTNLPAARTGRVLIDPATRSLAEADPGGW